MKQSLTTGETVAQRGQHTGTSLQEQELRTGKKGSPESSQGGGIGVQVQRRTPPHSLTITSRVLTRLRASGPGWGVPPLRYWTSLAGLLQPVPLQHETLRWVRLKVSAMWESWHQEAVAQPLTVKFTFPGPLTPVAWRQRSMGPRQLTRELSPEEHPWVPFPSQL